MKDKKFVIWGLKNHRHSHRYIHKGFYETLNKLNKDVTWVEDKIENNEIVKSGSLVISVGLAAKHLKYVHGAAYVLHNMERAFEGESSSILNLQVYTKQSSGERMDESIALYDSKIKTLYQPWGISEPKSEWLIPAIRKSNREYWVGSVWNNALGQGNSKVIENYVKVLHKHNIGFKKVGGTRWLTKNGISGPKNLQLVHRSPVGAAIVGDWQAHNGYVPCRIFKAVAAGHLPISNGSYENIFGNLGIFTPDLDLLVDKALDCSKISNMAIRETQALLEYYTYERALARIINLL